MRKLVLESCSRMTIAARTNWVQPISFVAYSNVETHSVTTSTLSVDSVVRVREPFFDDGEKRSGWSRHRSKTVSPVLKMRIFQSNSETSTQLF
jgi:hypothetical protein